MLEVAGIQPRVETRFGLQLVDDELPPIPAAVNQALLDKSGARIGDTLRATIVGAAGPAEAHRARGRAAVADALQAARRRGRRLARPRAVPRRGDHGGDQRVVARRRARARPGTIAATVAEPPFAAAAVVDRDAVEAGLVGDPLGLGVIGILGLGSIAALVFAAIGFLVTTTVSTQERLGEFALLKALGVAPRQLLSWMTAEGAALLFVGLVAGVGLGLVLAWLALPFATLTASGEPPLPTPVVVVPADGLLPIVLLAVALLLATVVLVGRLLPGARTSAVLRARDE